MADLLLPPSLASDERSQAFAQAAARFSEIDLTPVLVYLIDTVDKSALPLLADQFRVLGEGWQFTRNNDERRALIKHAIEIKRHRGTPWAIEQVLEILHLPGKLQEWFEYGGRPYHFKIRIDLGAQGIDEETYRALVKLIGMYKNKRSKLEALSIINSVSSEVPKIACTMLSGEVTTIFPKVPEGFVTHQQMHIAGGMQFVEITTIYPRNQA
jgi:phage tail P2-like protein